MNNKKIRGGATIWARQTIDSDIFYWRPDKWFKIWFFIVNKVNHKDNIFFKRGSNFMTYEEISHYTKASKDQIDGFMRYAKKNQMLTTKKTTRGMIVYVLKYNYFQDLDNYKNDTENETQTKHKRNTNDTINKNDKNDKNNKNDNAGINPAFNELIGYFYKSVEKSFNYKPKIDGGDGARLKWALGLYPHQDIEDMIDFYLKNKAEKNGITLKAVFSTHSINFFEQKGRKNNFL